MAVEEISNQRRSTHPPSDRRCGKGLVERPLFLNSIRLKANKERLSLMNINLLSEWLLTVLWALSLIGGSTAWAASPAAERLATEEDQEEDPEEQVLTLGEPEADGDSQREGFSWRDSVAENLRLGIDLISRVETTRQHRQAAPLNAIGLDAHKVISNSKGDVGTLVLQPYLVRRDNALMVMPHLEGPDDWELEPHDFYFNLTRWGRGRINIKAGHFDVPFGLEPLTDTHFTVKQLMPMQNLGMKKDWGVCLNGSLPRLDYEVSLTRGSGVQYANAGDNYVVAGRIGTPSDRNFIVGASGFYGRVLNPRRDIVVPRKRGGVDATWIFNRFSLKGEAAFGKNFNQDVFNSLLEFDWSRADGRLTAYVQGVYLGRKMTPGWDENVFSRFGVVWAIREHVSLAGEYSPGLVTMASRPLDAKFSLQLRLYM